MGPGAHAFDGATRRWNGARLDAYVAALAPPDGSAARLPPGGQEHLDGAAAAAEAVILALRTDRGVASATASRPPFAGALDWAATAGLVHATPDDRIVLTTRGRLLSNEVFSRLV